MPKYKNKPEIVLFKHILPKNYNWRIFKFGTRRHESVENTEIGAIVNTILNIKYKIGIEYYESFIILDYDFKTNFDIKKIVKKMRQFNLLTDKIEKEIPILAEDIIKNPKKYAKIERHW